jgi:tetratricopeptide (TPR) repeat protein
MGGFPWKPACINECWDTGEPDVRYWSVFLFLSAAADAAASGPPNAEAVAQLERDGRSLFVACEFKRAARVFESALSAQPDSAALYYWLGKSYARLAGVSSPLSAPKNARKARRNLEEAVKRDPRNREYLLELFDFYVDSPEWFHGGLQRAVALLVRVRPADSDPEPWLREIADSRKEHSGPGWRMQRAVLCTSDANGHIVPEL